MTSIALPRLLSEYLAARAQSFGRISVNADVDVRSEKRIDNAAIFTVRVVAAAVLSGHSQILPPVTMPVRLGPLRFFSRRLRRCRFGGVGRLRARTHWQITLPQFLHVGQFLQLAQTE